MLDKKSSAQAVHGSYRDPAGHVFQRDGRIFRAIFSQGADAYNVIRESSFIKKLVDEKRLVPFSEASPEILNDAIVGKEPIAILEHERLDFISHPYEWPFSALKSAALFHLDIQLDALEQNISLSDATAYNIQFNGPRPIFIDHLSFRRYEEGEIWDGHRQFCDQFLNPLLFQAKLGIPFNDWYNGSLDGITVTQLAPLLPKRCMFSFKSLFHVIIPAYFEHQALRKPNTDLNRDKTKGKLPRSAFKHMLCGLRKWIETLEPKHKGPTQWSNYESDNSYSDSEARNKQNFIETFVQKVQPNLLWDLGCNTGHYSSIALRVGAKYVIGFDLDHLAVEQAFRRAVKEELNFLPLYQNLTNPSSDCGWKQKERLGLNARRGADAIVALALIHHLVIGENVPLDQVVTWLIDCAPDGVIEFVPRSDPMVRKMLRNRKDIFDSYTEENFIHMVKSSAAIVRSERISVDGRLLIWYSKPKT